MGDVGVAVVAELLAMGLGIACALLLVVEAVRVTRVPWLGPRIHSFMTSFIDERDSGLLLASPSLPPFPANFHPSTNYMDVVKVMEVEVACYQYDHLRASHCATLTE